MVRADYEPLDISSYCNAGHEIFDGQHQELIYGNVLIRGLPFLIGSHDQHNTDNFVVSNGQDKKHIISEWIAPISIVWGYVGVKIAGVGISKLLEKMEKE